MDQQTPSPKPGRNKLVLQAGVAALVVILYIAVVVYSKQKDTQSEVASTIETGSKTQVVENPPLSESSDLDEDGDEPNTTPPPTVVTPPPATTTPAPTPKPTPPPTVTPPPAVVPPSAPSSSPYRDGTYTATGNYSSPGGREQIVVSLTLKDGVVTAATVTPQATNPTSKAFQQDFVENYKTFVVGKNIDTLSLKKVSGSSLTPIGFNAAAQQIKAQAES